MILGTVHQTMDFTTKEATATMATTDIIEATVITEEESTAGE